MYNDDFSKLDIFKKVDILKNLAESLHSDLKGKKILTDEEMISLWNTTKIFDLIKDKISKSKLRQKNSESVSIYKVIRQGNLDGSEYIDLLILGKEYRAFAYDLYIYDALSVVDKFSEVDKKRLDFDFIYNLRYYIRQAREQNYNVPSWEELDNYDDTKDWIQECKEIEANSDLTGF